MGKHGRVPCWLTTILENSDFHITVTFQLCDTDSPFRQEVTTWNVSKQVTLKLKHVLVKKTEKNQSTWFGKLTWRIQYKKNKTPSHSCGNWTHMWGVFVIITSCSDDIGQMSFFYLLIFWIFDNNPAFLLQNMVVVTSCCWAALLPLVLWAYAHVKLVITWLFRKLYCRTVVFNTLKSIFCCHQQRNLSNL